MHLSRRKSATKFLYVKTVSGKVVRHSLAYIYPCKNICWWTSLSTWKFGRKRPTPFKNADFRSLFARSASAAIPSERSSIITNRKFSTRFPMSLRRTAYVSCKPPNGAQKRKMAVFRQKVHLTWRKSATKFLCVNTVKIKFQGIHWPNHTCKNDSRATSFATWLVPTSVTLNDLEWRNNPYFTEFDSFAALQADYVTVVVDRFIALYNVLRILPSSYVWRKMTHAAVARSLCDSWASCTSHLPF